MYSSPKVLNFHHVRLVVQQSIRMALLVATMARSGSARARACLEMQNLTRSMSQLDLPNFLSCPLEILWKIFLELVPDAQAIRTCRLVCRTFLQGIDSSLQLRIFLKCDAWGYRQPSFRKDGRSLNLSEFSEKLDAHVRSWGDLDWQESHVRIPSPGAAYALSQGVFASVSFHSELSSVTCVTLPSRIMGTEAAVHTLDDVGFPVKDLVIDPSQDLLILLELYAIFRALTSILILSHITSQAGNRSSNLGFFRSATTHFTTVRRSQTPHGQAYSPRDQLFC